MFTNYIFFTKMLLFSCNNKFKICNSFNDQAIFPPNREYWISWSQAKLFSPSKLFLKWFCCKTNGQFFHCLPNIVFKSKFYLHFKLFQNLSTEPGLFIPGQPNILPTCFEQLAILFALLCFWSFSFFSLYFFQNMSLKT